MKILFYNAQIFSDNKILKGSVITDGDKITYVGNAPPKQMFDREINVNENLLMSGFVNAHCHTPATVLRGVSDDKSLTEWLEKIIPFEQKLSGKDIYWSTYLGLAEYIRGGITAIEENYGSLADFIPALKKSGIRARVAIGYPNVNTEERLSLEEQLDLVKKNNFKAVCYAHSIYGTSEDNFAKLITFARKNNLPVSTHLSETLAEVGDCTVKTELTPPELLEDYGFLDRTATLYHCVHCDKDDISLLKDYNVNIVTCSSSNLKLASGIAPLYALNNAGLNIALGTDGAYSNNNFDMFKEMFLASTLSKGTLYIGNAIPALDALNMATKNGYKALGMENLGDIKTGNFADLILVKMDELHSIPNNNIISNLVYSSKSSDVYLTMINGKIVYDNGKFDIGENIDKIIEENLKIKEKF